MWKSVLIGLFICASFLRSEDCEAGIRPGGLTEYPAYVKLGPNLLENSSFDVVDDDPVGWSDNGFIADSTVSHSGSVSYRITNANLIKHTQSARQSVPVKKGVYRISGWVKLNGVAATTGAGVRLSLRPGYGRLLGGTTKIVKGTSDWQYLERTNILITEDTIVKFGLECYREPDGTAWFDDVELREELPRPIDIFLLYPNYRGILFDDQPQDIRFDVTVNAPEGLVEVQVVDETNNSIVDQETTPIRKHFIATFDGSNLRNGHTYLFTFRILSDTIKYEYPAYRISKLPGSIRSSMTMSFDEHNRFLVRGKPTFILGVYDSGMGYPKSADSWRRKVFTKKRRLFELPINFYLNYWYGKMPVDAATSMMDVLQEHGILYLQTGNCFSRGFPGKNFPINTDDEYLLAISAHPGLGGFYTMDECISTLAPEMFGYYQRLKLFDPDGITFGASSSPATLFYWRDVVDVLSADPYALHWNNKNSAGSYILSKVADWSSLTRKSVKSSRPFCMVIQFFQFTKRDRWPTISELRNMSYMAITEGANGLFYWSLGAKALAWTCNSPKDPQDPKYDPDSVKGADGWCPRRVEYFNRLLTVMNELKSLEPALTSIDRPELLVSNSNSTAIHTRVKFAGETGYLIAYNYTGETVEVTFAWKEAIRDVQVYNESRTIITSENTFSDTFGPYEAHVYKIFRQADKAGKMPE